MSTRSRTRGQRSPAARRSVNDSIRRGTAFWTVSGRVGEARQVVAAPWLAVLEEIYSYRFRRPDDDWAIHRLYRRPGTALDASSGPRDALWAVRHGQTVIVTDGYHPFVTAHGIDAYYLNALAGDRRTMACSFDPDLDFVRGSWAAMAPDPRVPALLNCRQAPDSRPPRRSTASQGDPRRISIGGLPVPK